MAKCPNCNADGVELNKSLKNQVFRIEGYTCRNCKHNFKVMVEYVFSTEIQSAH